MIKHSVIFNFKDSVTPVQKQDFFEATQNLSLIEGVKHLQTLRQVSPKNKFTYCISMEFDTMEIYERYNNHPDHQTFIQRFWLKLIKDFLEIDLKPID